MTNPVQLASMPKAAIISSLGLAVALGWALWHIQMRFDRFEAPITQQRGGQPGLPPVSEPDSEQDGFIGVIIAGRQVDVGVASVGRIERILVELGERVTETQPLVVIDSGSLQQELRIQQASTYAAQSKLKRRLLLAKAARAAVTPEELDNATAEAARETEKTRLLSQQLEEATIRAPLAGIVTQLHLGVGAIGTPGAPILTLLSEGAPQVRFAIPEEQAGTVRGGESVVIELEATRGAAMARVVSVDPRVDSASRMIFATADLNVDDEATSRFTTGAIARVFSANSEAQRSARGRTTIEPR